MRTYCTLWLLSAGVGVVIFFGCTAQGEQGNVQITPTSEKVLNGRFEEVPLDDVLTVIFEQSGVRVRRGMGLRNILVNVTFEDTPFWEGMLELCKANNLAVKSTSGDAQIEVGLLPGDTIDMKVVGRGLLRASVGLIDDSSGADPSSRMSLEYFYDPDEVWLPSAKRRDANLIFGETVKRAGGVVG